MGYHIFLTGILKMLVLKEDFTPLLLESTEFGSCSDTGRVNSFVHGDRFKSLINFKTRCSLVINSFIR